MSTVIMAKGTKDDLWTEYLSSEVRGCQ